MFWQYETVPVGWKATPGKGAVAALVRGEMTGSSEPELDLELVLLTDDVQELRRSGSGALPEVLRCWHR